MHEPSHLGKPEAPLEKRHTHTQPCIVVILCGTAKTYSVLLQNMGISHKRLNFASKKGLSGENMVEFGKNLASVALTVFMFFLMN